jgi:hypothetical protein
LGPAFIAGLATGRRVIRFDSAGVGRSEGVWMSARALPRKLLVDRHLAAVT